MADATVDLKDIRDKLAEQALQLQYLEKVQQLSEELHTLKSDVDHKWNVLKVVSTLTLFVAGFVTGWLGIKTWPDFKKQISAEIDSRIAAKEAFYDDVMGGTILYGQGRYDAAIPKLLKCFNDGHTYDKNILIPLMASLNIDDNWEEGRPVLQKLRSNPAAFDKLNDPSIYVIVASFEVQSGISDLVESEGKSSEAAERIEHGNLLLQRLFEGLGPNQHDMRQRVLTNEWLYHIARHEFDGAQDVIDAIKASPRKMKVYGWDTLSDWRCVRVLRAKAGKDRSEKQMGIAKAQWEQLRARFFPNT